MNPHGFLRPRRPSLAYAGLLVLATLVPSIARAQSPSGAEQLFEQGRTLAEAGKFAEACPKFEASERIDPKPGTLLNLALCHEKEGKLATAWAEYNAVADASARTGQKERERVARQGAAALESLLPRVRLVVDPSETPSVSLDGKAVDAKSAGAPIPVDAGPHEVVATEPGRVDWKTQIAIPPGPGVQQVAIPKLASQQVVVALPPPPPPPPRAPVHAERLAGYVLVGVGGVAIVTGAIFGGLAFAEKSAAEGQCDAAGACSSGGQSDVSLKKTSEVVSTVGIIGGVVAAGAGVFLLLRARHDAAPSVAVTTYSLPGGAALGLAGSF